MAINQGDVFYARAFAGKYKKMHIHHADPDVVVFKSWNKHKKKWRWEVEERRLFEYCVNRKMYAKNKSDLD